MLEFMFGGESLSELATFIRDVRNDVKRLIEVLTALNNHLSKLETLVKSIEALTKELERANKNVEELLQVAKEMKG